MDVVGGTEIRFSAIQGDYSSSAKPDAEENGVPSTNIPGGNHFFSRDIGVYLQSGIDVMQNMKLTLGVRYDNNKIRTDEGYGNVFNPRVAIVYTPKSFIFKAIYAEAFKDATNREKYSTAAGKRELPNPDLQPEKVKNAEISVGKKINEWVFINANAYRSMYSNIIQEVQVTREDGTKTNQNQARGQAEIYGVNAYSDLKFGAFTGYANYTYTKPYMIDPKNSIGEILTDSLGNPYNKLRISDIASHQTNVGVTWLYKNALSVNLRTNVIGKRTTGYGTTVPTNPETFEPYALLHGSVNYEHKHSGLSLQLTVFNILNKAYFDPGLDEAYGTLASKLPQNMRNMYLSLNYTF